MRFIHHPDSLSHRPPTYLVRGEPRPVPEVPERATALAGQLRLRGVGLDIAPAYGPAPLTAVHTPDYVAFLETAHARWIAQPAASAAVIPNVHPFNRTPSYPTGIIGQVGYHVFDTAAPIVAGTWVAVRASADVAVHAAMVVANGEADAAYALCRPPGHHATRDGAGGFCYLNNAAIAGQSALPVLAARGMAPRIAILDVDLHHGNGTQDIFYDRDDVLMISVHADPDAFYPFFSGYRHERGCARGLGYTINRPLPLGTEETPFLEAVGASLADVARFGPSLLVLSLGFDTFIGDPMATFGVTTPGFGRLGAMIAQSGLPTVVVQEGGYCVDALPANLAAFLDGFEANRP
ncbi:histone deacetylase family protein [Telmatospirillum sp.]|uniref:histone deacetylase family protein n=1 Tax=Telmatospirillum sp. TaxID=2079197 RepID=UPI0028515498|nr:histone deacetylase family protein [Telmatospirillum sp.]MDR3441027.1 histone deacetylase family protein [Telmatospirillum sp.]